MTIQISGGAPLIQAVLASGDPVAHRRIILLGQVAQIKKEADKLPDIQKEDILARADDLVRRINASATLELLQKLDGEIDDLRELLDVVKDPIECNVFRMKFCPIVSLGGTVSIAEPNSGSGTFATDDLEVDGPAYNYSPSGGLNGLGLTIGVEDRLFKFGPYWLLGLEFQGERVQWDIDSSDRRDPLKKSQVTEIDYGVALTLGWEFPLPEGLFVRSLNVRGGVIIPWISRARYRADVEAENQSEGVLVTGTEPTFDPSGTPGNPAVQDWSSARSATLYGFNVFVGGNLGPYSEAGFTFQWRSSDPFGDEVGNEDALLARGLTQEEIDESGRGNRSIDVSAPERNAAILFTLRFRGDIAQMLGRSLGRK